MNFYIKILFVYLVTGPVYITNAYRPDSRPFISGDSFRSIANHIYDETTTSFNAKKVAAGDTIFINLSHIEQFFTKIHPHIEQPYILISHNHDYSAPGAFKHMLESSKLIAWFTQNPDLAGHPKLIGIPIGLSNKHWNHSREHDTMIARAQATLLQNVTKKHLLYVNFNVHTYPPGRKPVYDFFMTLPFCSWYSNRPYPTFLQDLAESKFVLSPHGNGLDCHRTWEALLMGSFPLVKTSTLDPLYENLPVLIVNDWTEVQPEYLEAKFKEMSNKKYNTQSLYFDYWYNKIKAVQNQYK